MRRRLLLANGVFLAVVGGARDGPQRRMGGVA